VTGPVPKTKPSFIGAAATIAVKVIVHKYRDESKCFTCYLLRTSSKKTAVYGYYHIHSSVSDTAKKSS
jgi:hypothetical protein